MSIQRRWKGKERAVEARDEGPGAADGIVLPLELVGSGIYDVAYTLPVRFGSRNQQFSLQIDTGSSDLWVASTSCSSQSCLQTGGRLYNPSGSTATGVPFNILYLQGSASGPVVWDSVSIGGYTIENQAIAAVSDVQNEPLAPNFSGILGLALPLNSIIATSLPPVTTNDADGAAWASNLFSITPSSSAPASPFLSLSLSRPGSDQIPSLLGIGRHPSALVPDPSKVLYSTLVADRSGTTFWKVNVRAITVYVDGRAQHVSVGRSVTGAVFPTAVLDSGVPLILTTASIANGIYGAIGISPASDGLYYVPCKTPLNLTMTIDSRPEIPLHPLDLTADPPNDNRAEFCIGLIQVERGLTQPGSSIGDMILGVPFLRNVYTVMAYGPPSTNGSFPHQNLTTHINPRLGLMSLTNSSRALDEFNTVRILNKPLTSVNTTTGVNDTKTVNVGGAKLSMGITVLLGLMCFIGLCGFLFLARYLFMRRRFRKCQPTNNDDGAGFMDQKSAYQLVKGGTAGGIASLSEDQLRQARYDAYRRNTASMASSDRTRVDSLSLSLGKKEEDFGFGIKIVSGEDSVDVWDPLTALDWGGDASVGRGRRKKNGSDASLVLPLNSLPSSPERSLVSHRRQQSDLDRVVPSPHQAQRSVDIPLLSEQPRQPPLADEGVAHETSALAVDGSHSNAMKDPPIPPPLPSDRHYLGSYSPMQGLHGLYADMLSYPDAPTVPPPDADEIDELGVVNGASMAGIGTALRTNKISRDSALLDRDGLGSR